MYRTLFATLCASALIATSSAATAQMRFGPGGVYHGGGFRPGPMMPMPRPQPRFYGGYRGYGGYGGYGGGGVVVIPGQTYIFCQPWQGQLVGTPYGPMCVR